ncbi:alpha/beta fold hydrolase [Demetria terragena]|uniref:alpha/beta fold hydrolase n=1 Tax=Demetria terragena TaxID=63959 RepID=UPI00036507E1|nr:alpha/beta hydrolase [Demetria terragena]
MTTQVVLVPGFWLGAWAWDAVAERLRTRGLAAAALTLPGLDGEPSDVGPQDHADAIIAALDQEADRRVLVVHSGAAVPGTMVIDQHPELVDHIVYADTAPVADGFAMNASLSEPTFRLEEVWDEELAGGSMRGLTDEQLATFKERAVPQPGRTVSEPVRLTNPARAQVPATMICTAATAAEYQEFAANGANFLAGLSDYPDLAYVDLPTGHWPMWSMPDELSDLIAGVAQA